MAIDFPNSPDDGQKFVDSTGKTWIYIASKNKWDGNKRIHNADFLEGKDLETIEKEYQDTATIMGIVM